MAPAPAKAMAPAPAKAQNKAQVAPLTQTLGGDWFLSSGPGDCELSVDPEVFGRGGVGVDSEYDLKLRIGGNLGRLGMGHSSLLTVQTVRW